MSNNFDQPILLDTGTGTAAVPADYIGFTRAAGAAISTGARIYHGTDDPNGVLTAPTGSLWLRSNGIVSVNTGVAVWVQLGTLAGAVILTSIDSTATADFDWDLDPASATALGLDAGGVTLFGIDTVTDTVFIGATAELRLDDAAAFTVGTPGTDVVMTADGAGLTVTGTGAIDFVDDMAQNYGTGLDWNLQFDTGAAPDELVFQGLAVVAGGAGAQTFPFHIATGDRTVDDVVGGAPPSGDIVLETGFTDITAAGNAGESGLISLTTGDSDSTAGTSAASGLIAIVTGDSADLASGLILLETGTAGGVRGVLDIDIDEINLATQATDFEIIDNSATALTITQAANNYVGVSTANDAEALTFGNVVTNPQFNLLGAGAVEVNGVDMSDRLVMVERFERLPSIVADIANQDAHQTLAIIGTTATSAECTYAAGGGINLATNGAAADSTIVYGQQGARQGSWHAVEWNAADEIIIKCNCRGIDTADTRVAAMCKLTVAMDDTTDADGFQLRFDQSDGVTSNVNWVACTSDTNVDELEDTGVAYANDTNYRIVMSVSAGLEVSYFINGLLVNTPANHTVQAATDLGEPMFGISQPAGVAARSFELHAVVVSKLYT